MWTIIVYNSSSSFLDDWTADLFNKINELSIFYQGVCVCVSVCFFFRFLVSSSVFMSSLSQAVHLWLSPHRSRWYSSHSITCHALCLLPLLVLFLLPRMPFQLSPREKHSFILLDIGQVVSYEYFFWPLWPFLGKVRPPHYPLNCVHTAVLGLSSLIVSLLPAQVHELLGVAQCFSLSYVSKIETK